MDTRRIKVWVGDNIDFLALPSDWDQMSAYDQENYISECSATHLENNIDSGGKLVTTDDKEYQADFYSDSE